MSQKLNNKKYKILIAAIHYPIASGRYIARAFRRMGHDVRTIGPATGLHVWGKDLKPGTEWKPDIDVTNYCVFPEYKGAILDLSITTALSLCGEWQPELILTADSAFDLVGYPDEFPCPKVLYGVDNHVRDYDRGGLSKWDYKFLAHTNGYRMQDENTYWLPCAYDPELHKATSPLHERFMHVAMLGVMYDDRAAIVDKLGEKYRILAGTGPVLEDYTHYYNQTVVSLCKSFCGDVAMRVFETAAMGCVLLSDFCPDFEKLGLRVGTHYLEYQTPDDALGQLDSLFAGPTERIERLSQAAREWVKPHTWDDRCQYILDVVFGKGQGNEA